MTYLSATEVEDNNEVIENLSNSAFDESRLGDLMILNPNFCNCSQGLEHQVRWFQYLIDGFFLALKKLHFNTY